MITKIVPTNQSEREKSNFHGNLIQMVLEKWWKPIPVTALDWWNGHPWQLFLSPPITSYCTLITIKGEKWGAGKAHGLNQRSSQVNHQLPTPNPIPPKTQIQPRLSLPPPISPSLPSPYQLFSPFLVFPEEYSRRNLSKIFIKNKEHKLK